MFEKICEMIGEQLDVENICTIQMSSSLSSDLEADSLDAVEIIMAIEDEFGIEISDDIGESFKTIGDIVKFVEENTKKLNR
ncbi:MAG: acyl carrier protein [Alkaliphilus sp.]